MIHFVLFALGFIGFLWLVLRAILSTFVGWVLLGAGLLATRRIARRTSTTATQSAALHDDLLRHFLIRSEDYEDGMLVDFFGTGTAFEIRDRADGIEFLTLALWLDRLSVRDCVGLYPDSVLEDAESLATDFEQRYYLMEGVTNG